MTRTRDKKRMPALFLPSLSNGLQKFTSLLRSSRSAVLPLIVLVGMTSPAWGCVTVEIKGDNIDNDCNPATLDKDGVELFQPLIGGEELDFQGTFTRYTDVAYAAGALVDKIDFGYRNWSAGSGDTVDPDGDANDLSNSMGEHNAKLSGQITPYRVSSGTEWDFKVPRAGTYVFSMMTWSTRTGRTSIPYYYEAGQKKVLGGTPNMVDFWLVTFPAAGTYRFGVSPAWYLFHAALFELHPSCKGRSDSGQHPRFLPASQETLREWWKSGWVNYLAKQTSNVATTIKNQIQNNDMSMYLGCNSRGIEQILTQVGLGYVYSNDPTIARAGIEALKKTVSRPNIQCSYAADSLAKGELLHGMAIAYDLLFDAMTPSERDEIACKFERHANFAAKHAEFSNHRGDGEYWYAADSSNNWGFAVVGRGVGAASIALSGYVPEIAERWTNMAKRVMRDAARHTMANGNWFTEGLTYGEYAFASAIEFTNAIGRESDPGFFDELLGAVRKQALTSVYLADSRLWNFVPFSHYASYWQPSKYKYLHGFAFSLWAASVLQDPILGRFHHERFGKLGLAEEDFQAVRIHDYASTVASMLFAYRPMPQKEFSEWDLPLGKAFPDGIAVSRANPWGDKKNNILAVISQRIKPSAHNEPDWNSPYYEAYGQPLVLSYARAAENKGSHSTVTIDGKNPHLLQDTHVEGLTSFLSTEHFDFVSGSAKEATAAQTGLEDVTTVKRAWIFPRTTASGAKENRYLFMTDRILAGNPHDFTWNLMASPGSHSIATVAPGQYRFTSLNKANTFDGILPVNLDIFLSSGGSTTTFTPAIAGRLLAATTAAKSTSFSSAALLLPWKAETSAPVPARQSDGAAYGFTFESDRLFTRNGSGASGITLEGEALVERKVDNKVVMFGLVDGTKAKTASASFGIEFSLPISALVHFPSSEEIHIIHGDESHEAQPLTATLYGTGAHNLYIVVNEEVIPVSKDTNKISWVTTTNKQVVRLSTTPLIPAAPSRLRIVQ